MAGNIDLTRIERSNFYFGKTLGEGSYARVVHAKLKIENAPEFAVKIMEKAHIQREDKVSFLKFIYLSSLLLVLTYTNTCRFHML